MMYVDDALISSNDKQVATDLATVRRYLDEHGNALANAAYRLGGGAASGAVLRLANAISEGCRLTAWHIRQLERLYALLVLENVGDHDRIETALFVELTPESQVMEEICRLADSLDDLLNTIGQGDAIPHKSSLIQHAA
jgi:hypothetical protein